MNKKSLLGRISMKHVFFIVLTIAAVWAVYSLLLVRRLAPLAEETQKQKAEFWANQIEPNSESTWLMSRQPCRWAIR